MNLRSLRPALAVVVLALLTLWPPVHMVLARATGFAPSRLGGWGMYAAPDESFTGVEIFVLTRGAELPAGVLSEDSPHRPEGIRFTFEVHLTVVTPDGLQPLDGSGLETEQLDRLWFFVRGVRAFPSKGSARRLAAYLRHLPLPGGEPEGVLILRATPAVDLDASRTVVELTAYRVVGDEVEVRRARVAGDDELARMEDTIRRMVSGGAS